MYFNIIKTIAFDENGVCKSTTDGNSQSYRLDAKKEVVIGPDGEELSILEFTRDYYSLADTAAAQHFLEEKAAEFEKNKSQSEAELFSEPDFSTQG